MRRQSKVCAEDKGHGVWGPGKATARLFQDTVSWAAWLSGLLSATWPGLPAGWGTERLLPTQEPPSLGTWTKGPRAPLRQGGS